ncbi:NEQ065 [Nanoarchaeum equitans Kin4-M]|uniref:Large ribosomal subunit protein uL23 n=1 Tax=Nanoarchaeum equitans (strain Kin4-M) TaxID=228908 RepID=RL23_NANEQ|nr:RecName: Full=Large ribosomal subunit protein uL23; AltName: Full=50S ribosomal protein L23 [Nanoarchaeum equitans Kin4-M]AAR38920.1 NEQ065 [Nanoarchaeum equitans Kin4-M]
MMLLQTEKALRLLEQYNTITILVPREYTKSKIKEFFEKKGYKVKKVNTLITKKGLKKAYVRFKEEGVARKVAEELGGL